MMYTLLPEDALTGYAKGGDEGKVCHLSNIIKIKQSFLLA